MLKKKNFYFEKVIAINRCTKVVRGGRKFSFSALVVVGNKKGYGGIGFGKAGEIPNTIRKATDVAYKNMTRVEIFNDTIHHTVYGKQDSSFVILKPAPAGSGIRASSKLRYLFEAVGIKNIITKSYGSNNVSNVLKASLNALWKLTSTNKIKRD